MKRVPITHPKVDGMRLCSMPGGRWQLQHMVAAHGTRERHMTLTSDGQQVLAGGDRWEGVRRTTDFATASAQLCSFIPVSAVK